MKVPKRSLLSRLELLIINQRLVQEFQHFLMPTTQAQPPLQLDVRQDADRLVVLTPNDEDRFVRSCQWVVEASRLGISRDVWLRELHGLLNHVRRWAEGLGPRIKAALAIQRDDQIAIFIVPATGRFEAGLSDLLTDLDLELAEKYQACPCDVLQMPDKALGEFEHRTDNRLAILIYGNGSRAQGQVAT